MHGCFVFRFRAVFTVRFFGGEIPLLVLLCWSLGRFPLTLFANIVLPFRRFTHWNYIFDCGVYQCLLDTQSLECVFQNGHRLGC